MLAQNVAQERVGFGSARHAAFMERGDDEMLCRFEGIIPALESAHAVAEAIKLAPTMPRESVLLVNLSGRGDKDLDTVIKAVAAKERKS